MISYREKELVMVQKFLADHVYNTAVALEQSNPEYFITNSLPNCSSYEEIVEYVKSQGYYPDIRIEDLLSKDELDQLDKEYAAIEKEFKKQTGLNKTDAVFIITAIVLQMVRQIFQPPVNFDAFKSMNKRDSHNDTADEAKDSAYDREKADKKKDIAEDDESKGSRYYHASVQEIADIAHVPYDIINGTKNYNVKLNGKNHRAKTLGHDPWLGYLFGTCNILTNTMSLSKDNSFRTLHIGKDESGKPAAIAEADPIKMFKYSAKRYKDSKATIGLAVIKQAYHIKSDEYSKEGLSLPFLQLLFDSDIIQELCESGIDYAKLDFLGTVATQTMFAEVINYVIAVAHRITIICEENKRNSDSLTKDQLLNSLKKQSSLTEARTRKVIIISECIASATNALVIGGIEVGAALTENEVLAKEAAEKIDFGGYLSTILHLFSDIRFITKIKKEFIKKSVQENYEEKLRRIASAS